MFSLFVFDAKIISNFVRDLIRTKCLSNDRAPNVKFLKKENLSTGYLSHSEVSISMTFHGLSPGGIHRKEKLIHLSHEAGLASWAGNLCGHIVTQKGLRQG